MEKKLQHNMNNINQGQTISLEDEWVSTVNGVRRAMPPYTNWSLKQSRNGRNIDCGIGPYSPPSPQWWVIPGGPPFKYTKIFE